MIKTLYRINLFFYSTTFYMLGQKLWKKHCWFFWRIKDTTIPFWNFLTFKVSLKRNDVTISKTELSLNGNGNGKVGTTSTLSAVLLLLENDKVFLELEAEGQGGMIWVLLEFPQIKIKFTIIFYLLLLFSLLLWHSKLYNVAEILGIYKNCGKWLWLCILFVETLIYHIKNLTLIQNLTSNFVTP